MAADITRIECAKCRRLNCDGCEMAAKATYQPLTPEDEKAYRSRLEEALANIVNDATRTGLRGSLGKEMEWYTVERRFIDVARNVLRHS